MMLFLKWKIISRNKAIEIAVTFITANGKQLLTIPVKHQTKESRKKTKDTLVENDFHWQDQHFKSLQIAYRTSPFFEFL